MPSSTIPTSKQYDDFKDAIEFVFSEECPKRGSCYVNDPDDPGGETNFGISKRQYPNEDIKGMTKPRAMHLLHRDYWLKSGSDKLNWPMSLYVFDAYVNMHPTVVKKLRKSSSNWFDFLMERLFAYARLAQRKPKLRKFLPIWVMRVVRVYRYGKKIMRERT